MIILSNQQILRYKVSQSLKEIQIQILIIESRLINNKQKLTRNKSLIYGVKVLSLIYRNKLHEKMNQLIVTRAIYRHHKQRTSKILRERKMSSLINKLE